MLKKKLLILLVIFQGILIIAGIIAIIFGVIYKMSITNNASKIINKNIDLNDIYLIDENSYQQKIINNDRVIFQIIDIDSNKILKELVIEKN